MWCTTLSCALCTVLHCGELCTVQLQLPTCSTDTTLAIRSQSDSRNLTVTFLAHSSLAKASMRNGFSWTNLSHSKL